MPFEMPNIDLETPTSRDATNQPNASPARFEFWYKDHS